MEKQKENNNFWARTVVFIKENVIILYSLLLLVLIPAAFFVNTYLATSKYEKVIDTITYTNVTLVEDTINSLLRDRLDDAAGLQVAIDGVVKQNGQIISMSILVPEIEQGNFKVIASSDAGMVDEVQDQVMNNMVAWTNPVEGIAYLDSGPNGRFWRVTKVLLDSSERRLGLIDISFSLRDSDALMNNVISDAYLILFVTVLVVLLLVINQARLVGYAAVVGQLKEVDRMKDMFISMASHELRSPLTAIKGYMELLTGSKTINLDEETGRYVTNINSSVQRLGNLVEDILDVSRLEGNRLPIEITTFDPLPPISKSVEEMRAAAIQKGLALNYKPGEASLIRADESRVKQVVVNLIGNAVKYTEKGSVDIITAIKGSDFLITVADTGIGMSADDQANLFQKFYRIKNEKTRNISGTGLGLWITKEVVERMGGKIAVESIENVGTHFVVHLPLFKK